MTTQMIDCEIYDPSCRKCKAIMPKYKAIVPGATELNINGSSYVYTVVSVAPS